MILVTLGIHGQIDTQTDRKAGQEIIGALQQTSRVQAELTASVTMA